MVNLGFIPQKEPIPAPDMSFMRLFSDGAIGWQHRGQFAMWTGVSAAEGPKYRLLERIGNRVAEIERKDGSPVFHKIANGTPFMIENLTGFWLTVDSDAMWVDTPCPTGRYALIAIGGRAGKPSRATVDWTCPGCGTAIHAQSFDIAANGFPAFLRKAHAAANEFNANPQLRACPSCNAIHPAVNTSMPNEAQPAQPSQQTGS
jgi:rubredoxin